ncbi:MAG: DUF4129 domain-containing protein, partial [Treponema sp.]|nr:DUF4129 domain-containing protein [Treponema sp.]
HLYSQGLHREAWGRCYAAALAAFTRYGGIRFPPGATEYRCLSLVRLRTQTTGLRTPGHGSAFAELIRHWVALAYGGSVPPDGAFEDSLAWVGALCRPEIPPEAAS